MYKDSGIAYFVGPIAAFLVIVLIIASLDDDVLQEDGQFQEISHRISLHPPTTPG